MLLVFGLYANLTIQQKVCKHMGNRIQFDIIENGSTRKILGCPVTFFDIGSTKMQQYGFTVQLTDGRKLCCLGDEPYNPICEKYVNGTDWLLCEAFCRYCDREIFKPYEKHHTTVKEACELAQQLGVPNLVLWHTEDKHIKKNKKLYSEEGSAFYNGNLFVPDDLDVIEL